VGPAEAGQFFTFTRANLSYNLDRVDAITPRLSFDGVATSLPVETVVSRMEQALLAGAPAWNPYGFPGVGQLARPMTAALMLRSSSERQ
jgi:hypothetical protein